MKSSATLVATLAVSALVLVVAIPSTYALDLVQIRCQETIAKQAAKFVVGLLQLEQQCREADLTTPGSCLAPDPMAIATLRTKLGIGIDRYCYPSLGNLAALGFPGPCDDADPLDGFTLDDLKDCIESSHTAGVDAILALLFDAAIVGPLPSADFACQRAFDKSGLRFVKYLLPTVQKCRNGILRGRIVGVQPRNCATDHPPTAAAVAKLERVAWSSIVARCTPEQVIRLELCSPDQVAPDAAADCLIAAIRRLIDNPVVAAPSDLIDYEYAEPPVCGDHHLNRVSEECDGPDDAACPEQCGAPDGFFACLCQNIPRQRVVEHANADLDLGWSGRNHDSTIVEGGGYVADLNDCDNVFDFDCNVGPTCSLPPHTWCSGAFGAPYTNGDTICAGLGQGICRTTRGGATGPHCEIDLKQECASNAQCPGSGDRCVKVPHGPPLPLSAGGISVCIEDILSEDVVGTTNLLTGAGAVRIRQQSITHLGPAINQPCPVCGGFCSGALGLGDTPGARDACIEDSDCPGSFCVQENICSWGPNADKACRPDPPFGGPTAYFGNPSVDCPPNIPDIGKLDILFNPATTDTVTKTASVACNALGFEGKVCFQGANDGRECTVPLDCPGGSCINQCFCPNEGPAQKPNACLPACKGGVFDAQPCTDDSECDPPNGFCHEADCRHNVADTASAQEGQCTTGPVVGSCSVTEFKGCLVDAECTPPNCPFCETTPPETCVLVNQQCFVNSQIVRQGSPGTPDRVSAAVFCIPPTSEAAVNYTAGWPGPGAMTQPETTIEVGFQ